MSGGLPPAPDSRVRTLIAIRDVLTNFEKDCLGAELRELQLLLAVARKAADDAIRRLGLQFNS